MDVGREVKKKGRVGVATEYQLRRRRKRKKKEKKKERKITREGMDYI